MYVAGQCCADVAGWKALCVSCWLELCVCGRQGLCAWRLPGLCMLQAYTIWFTHRQGWVKIAKDCRTVVPQQSRNSNENDVATQAVATSKKRKATASTTEATAKAPEYDVAAEVILVSFSI